MESKGSILVTLLLLQYLSVLCVAQDFDFFYFVQQWPASLCDTKASCCYPITGKPATNFSIHGLWAINYHTKTRDFCDRANLFDYSKISDLSSRMQVSWPSLSCPSSDNTKFWSHEWEKHGTCVESSFDQHKYFEATLNLKDSVDLLQVLKNAGIEPVDGKLYSLDSITEAIQKGVGFVPRILCNKDASKISQLKEIYLCADKNASSLIECPIIRRGNCPSKIEFPSFGSPTPALVSSL